MRIKSYTGDETTSQLLKESLKEHGLKLQLIVAVIAAIAGVVISILGVETYHILNATTAGQINVALLGFGALVSLSVLSKLNPPNKKKIAVLMIAIFAIGLVLSSLAAFGVVSGTIGAAGGACIGVWLGISAGMYIKHRTF